MHRLINPLMWQWHGRTRVERLSDAEFRNTFPLRQDPAGFLLDFHESARLRFFFHPRNKKDFFLYLLTQTQPYEEVLSDAQDVLENKFEAFGLGKTSLGESIHWQRDFSSGRIWPMKPLSAGELLDIGKPSDIKIVWELNRFHQVWWLGKAYWATQNEEYARKFGELVEDWIQKNPVGRGPNWSIAMEVALRACNWIAGYYFFCDSKSLTDDFWLKFLKSLYSHGRYVESHLEYAKRNGNHLLADVVGLLMMGVFFRPAPFGARWTEWGARTLQEEMQTQVYPDGVNYEKSVGYHRLVLELFYTAAILCRNNKIPLEEAFTKRLEKMFEFVQAYTRPDGSSPVVGDADDARLFQFSTREDFNDHRHALSVGALLFDRADFRSTAERFTQDALWLFGGEGFEKHQRLQASVSAAESKDFPDGGYYVMRSGEVHLFVDAGDIGMLGRGGHGHNDTFSFEFWCDGSPLIVDSGTFTYSADVYLRNEFRRSQAHNTLVVDKKEIADFTGLWSIQSDDTNPKILTWSSDAERDVLEVEHSAYLSLPSRITHRRRFEFAKAPLSLIVTDALLGSGSHLFESYLHFAPGVSLELTGPQKAIARNQNGRYIVSVSRGEFSPEDTWYSRSYGVKERNKTLKISLNAIVPAEIQITLSRDTAA
ncbi:MAG: alginate lyase family protein [Ignavibacteriales bacterium]|nr:alginate lyase family protein [Ignavibacteriales bacterium]